jgi:hypothetical protein
VNVEPAVVKQGQGNRSDNGVAVKRTVDVRKRLAAVEALDPDRCYETVGVDLQQDHICAASVQEIGDALNLMPEGTVDEALSASERPTVDTSYSAEASRSQSFAKAR